MAKFPLKVVPLDPVLEFFLKREDTALLKDCATFLKVLGYQVVATPDYVWGVPVNPLPVCLTAHVDTVGRPDKTVSITRRGNRIGSRRGILGADDRAGVYAITRILNARKGQSLPYVLFTNGEEKGGIGAQAFINAGHLDDPDFLDLFIGLDRQGRNEYVYYSYTLPDEIANLVERHGMIWAQGSFSDVMLLTEACGVPHVNLSVGYQCEHTKWETLHLVWLEEQIQRVSAILNDTIPSTRIEGELSWGEDEDRDYFLQGFFP